MTSQAVLRTTVCLAISAATARADINTWTGGAGDQRWENPANWSQGSVPDPTDDVNIPEGSGIIFVDSKIKVRSLTLEGGNQSALRTPVGKNTDLVIDASIFVSVGSGCDLLCEGGSLFINTGLSVTNRGRIWVSPGESKPGPGFDGGGVVITAGTSVDNHGGEIRGATGSAADTAGGIITVPLDGGEGGPVIITAGQDVAGGTITGGNGGAGANGGANGASGGTKITAPGPLLLPPTTLFGGKDVSLKTDIGGLISMAGANGTVVQADANIYIDSCPSCLVDMIANPPGIPVLVAGESICIQGIVQLDPGVTIDMLTIPPAIVQGEPCAPRCNNDPTWYDPLEGHFDGPLDEFGWKGWNDDPAFAPAVTGEPSPVRSGFRSLEVEGADRGVHEFCGPRTGLWSFEAWQYIPSDFASGTPEGEAAGSYFLLLNTYVPNVSSHESLRFWVDPGTDLIRISTGSGATTADVPIDPDRWKKIQSIIDLDNDWTQIYYDDELVTEYPWTGGVLGDGGGALDIKASEFNANGATKVHYDDLRLAPIEGCDSQLNGDFDQDGSDLLEETLRGSNSCDPDTDDDSVQDGADNCPTTPNADQADCETDGVGDACAGEPDCNANDIPDSCDIALGHESDDNLNGIPDVCEQSIPATSTWSVIALAILLALAGTLAVRRDAETLRRGSVT